MSADDAPFSEALRSESAECDPDDSYVEDRSASEVEQEIPPMQRFHKHMRHELAVGSGSLWQGHLPGHSSALRARRPRRLDSDAVRVPHARPAWQDARHPKAAKCGRVTANPVHADAAEGPIKLQSLRPLQKELWHLELNPDATNKERQRRFSMRELNREHCGLLVSELQSEVSRAASCNCSKAKTSTGKQDVFERTEDITAEIGKLCGHPRCAHCAGDCECSWKDTIRELVQRGAEINGHDWNGDTPLLHAARHGHVRVVSFLIYLRADPFACKRPNGWTALHEAAKGGRAGVCEVLLEAAEQEHAAKSILEAPCSQLLQSTPLLEAASGGHAAALQVLLKHRANIDARLEDGNTALMLAAGKGHLEVARLLVTQGCLVCAGPGGAERKKLVDMGRKIGGCRGRCQSKLHNTLRNHNLETAAMIARSRSKMVPGCLDISKFLEARGSQ